MHAVRTSSRRRDGRCLEKDAYLSSKILFVDPISPVGAKVGDILMLVRTGGRNRTEKEYRDLLSKGGFKTERVITTSAQSIFEAMPGG